MQSDKALHINRHHYGLPRTSLHSISTFGGGKRFSSKLIAVGLSRIY